MRPGPAPHRQHPAPELAGLRRAAGGVILGHPHLVGLRRLPVGRGHPHLDGGPVAAHVYLEARVARARIDERRPARVEVLHRGALVACCRRHRDAGGAGWDPYGVVRDCRVEGRAEGPRIQAEVAQARVGRARDQRPSVDHLDVEEVPRSRARAGLARLHPEPYPGPGRIRRRGAREGPAGRVEAEPRGQRPAALAPGRVAERVAVGVVERVRREGPAERHAGHHLLVRYRVRKARGVVGGQGDVHQPDRDHLAIGPGGQAGPGPDEAFGGTIVRGIAERELVEREAVGHGLGAADEEPECGGVEHRLSGRIEFDGEVRIADRTQSHLFDVVRHAVPCEGAVGDRADVGGLVYKSGGDFDTQRCHLPRRQGRAPDLLGV